MRNPHTGMAVVEANYSALPAWQTTRIPGFGPGILAEVAGNPLWFASTDVELAPVPASLLCLLAPWCALEGRTLTVPANSVPADLADNIRSATALMAFWWRHDPLRMEVLPSASPGPGPLHPASSGTALFFSGGIDSFHSLVSNPEVGLLVFIAGFDIRLHNRSTWEALVHSWRELAAERGLRFIAIATNVREHPVLGQMRWARYHGAVLASVAHLLGGQASRWLISASYQLSNLVPWGSHPDLDWRFGGGGIEIRHAGAELWRAEKLASMAGEDFVHRRLRVCYANPRAAGDCGQCEKCIRTRLIYWQDLPGVHCASMPAGPALAEALDLVPKLEMRSLVRIYRRFLERATIDDGVTKALRALIMRSEGEF
ncbi:MAG: hypothetical protein ABI567_02435 [Gammaproteobacteria bacterium]